LNIDGLIIASGEPEIDALLEPTVLFAAESLGLFYGG
jgi:hypothetical protein